MSNNILPSFPGLAWGIKKTPMWATKESNSVSGRQYTLRRRLYPLWSYRLPYEVLRDAATLTELQQIVGFFNARNGKYDDFLYLDQFDNAASAQPMGIGNGVTTEFEILSTFGGFTEPVGGVNAGTLQVFLTDWRGTYQQLTTSRSNLLRYSEQFDNAAWVALSVKNVVANAAVAPDSTTTAETVQDNSAAAFQGILQAITVPNDSLTRCFSLYVKKTTGATSSTFGINVSYTGGGTPSSTNARLNTDTGVAATTGNPVTVVDAGTYWRISVRLANNSSGHSVFNVNLYAATSAHGGGTVDVVTAQGTHTIWGAQLEIGTLPTSYLPTTSAAVTRTDITLNSTLNAVTFAVPPASAIPVTWTGTHYKRCRFRNDELSLDALMSGRWKADLEFRTFRP